MLKVSAPTKSSPMNDNAAETTKNMHLSFPHWCTQLRIIFQDSMMR
jgi:hypothetical protein